MIFSAQNKLRRLNNASFQSTAVSISLLGINIFFLIVFLGLQINHLVYLVTLYTFTGVVSLIMRSNKSKYVLKTSLILSLIILVTALGLAKYEFFSEQEIFYPILDFLEIDHTGSVVAVLGISYFVFRAIHFLVDTHTRAITSFSWLSLFNFLFFFPSFLSGPIDRYQSYVEKEKALSFKHVHIEAGLQRIVIGVIKKFGLAVLFATYSVSNLNAAQIQYISVLELWIAILCCTMWLYFDFSGYCDIAIGTSKIIGIQLPENFDSPFKASNLQDFWNRWHMSLSTWIRDYLFFPLTRFFYQLSGKPKGNLLQAIALALAFFLSGIWHGDGYNFLLWGLLHGLALATLLIYRNLAKRYFKNAYKKLKSSFWYVTCCWFATFIFINLATLLFFCSVDNALLIYANLLG